MILPHKNAAGVWMIGDRPADIETLAQMVLELARPEDAIGKPLDDGTLPMPFVDHPIPQRVIEWAVEFARQELARPERQLDDAERSIHSDLEENAGCFFDD